MSKISQQKKEKIMSNIISTLYEYMPQSLFTSDISKVEARDEEFVKKLLLELEKKKLIVAVRKNPNGIPYVRRTRWRLSNLTFDTYKNLNKK